VLAQLLALTALIPLAGIGPAGFLSGAAYGLVVAALLAVGFQRAGRALPGPADVVTLARSTLVGCVTALVADNAGPKVATVALAVVALVLDAVDGHVARSTGTDSPLGARFDMEVDAYLILVLSLLLARWVGWWVLAGGLMRYAFIGASRLWPWLAEPLPPSFARKVVAAAQGVVLLVAGSRLLPWLVSLVAAAIALALLVWSFGRDTLWLVRNRQERVAVAAAAA
jgi:phosphatidylglycerophosphate synthase